MGDDPRFDERLRRVDADARRTARDRVDRLAKPPGSLGRLEDLAVQLAGIAGRCPVPPLEHPALLVAAGDHGVHARAVTRWPQELSAAVAGLVADGRAVSGAFARQVGASVTVHDVGLVGPRPAGVVDARIRTGTRDLVTEPAMTCHDAAAAMAAGATAVTRACSAGADLVVLGEVGIANTTPSSALLAALTGRDPADVTGPGAGNDPATVERKVRVVRAALARHGDDRDPLALLASLGGTEHAALAGMVLEAACRRLPVILDGVTTVAAALVAARVAPVSGGYLIAGHRSSEPGATAGLAELGLAPLLELDLRLGEGTGGLLAVPLVQAAVRLLSEVEALDDL